MENDSGLGKSWNLPGNAADASSRFQIHMFSYTKIAIIVATSYVFWTAGMPKMISWPGLHPGPDRRAYNAPQAP